MATLMRGSHGSPFAAQAFHPVLITDNATAKTPLLATDVYQVIWNHLQ